MRDPEKYFILSAGCGFVGLIVFFSAFFAGVHPDIEKNTQYVQASCIATQDPWVRPYRRCTLACDKCSEYSGSSSCPSLEALDARLKRYDVTAASIATVSGACGGGQQCCRTRCETCQRCQQVCTGTDSSSGSSSRGSSSFGSRRLLGEATGAPDSPRQLRRTCRQSCSTYSCNCRCVDSTQDKTCIRSCGRGYEAWVLLDVRTSTGLITGVEVVDDHGTSEAAARAQAGSGRFAFNRTRECYVPSDFTGGRLGWGSVLSADDRGYNVAGMVFTGLGAFCILSCFAPGVYALFEHFGYRDSSVGLTHMFCVGIIIPIVILLPIRVDGAISHQAQDELTCAICVVAMIGFAPAAHFPVQTVMEYFGMDTKPAYCALFGIGYAVPMGALLPAAMVVSRNQPDSIAGTVLYIIAFAPLYISAIVVVGVLCFNTMVERFQIRQAVARYRAEERARAEEQARERAKAEVEAKRKAEEEAYLKAHPEEAKRKAEAAERARFAEEERLRWGDSAGTGENNPAAGEEGDPPSGSGGKDEAVARV